MLKIKRTDRWCWLITKHTTSRMDVFTTYLFGDRKALAVFSFEEEAQMFLDLCLAGSRDGWRVRQTSVGELMSVLYGPCSDTRKVVLDPVPKAGGEEMSELSNMHRDDFLRFLLGEEVPSKIHFVPPQTYRPRELVGHGHVA